MGRKSKFILGLESKRYSSERIKHFSEEEKRFIIEDYLSSGKTKRDIWYKYTGYEEEHGGITRWMRMLGYIEDNPKRKSNFVSKTHEMKNKKSLDEQASSFENLQLKKRIEELETQLKDAEMKAVAYSTMVDIAEKELNISIRKKYNTKPSKK